MKDAERFLAVLGHAHPEHSFQTYSREELMVERVVKGKPRITDPNVRVRRGVLAEHEALLRRMNERGAAVSVTVNATEGAKRRRENIIAARALFVDLDGYVPIDVSALPPTMTVQSRKGEHMYWVLRELDPDLARWEKAQYALAVRFGADRQCCTPQFAMRVPGFRHNKADSTDIIVELTECEPSRLYTVDAVIEAFGLDLGIREKHATVRRSSHRSGSRFGLPTTIAAGHAHDTLRRYAVSLHMRGFSAQDVFDSLRECADARVHHRRIGDAELQGLVDWALRTAAPSSSRGRSRRRSPPRTLRDSLRSRQPAPSSALEIWGQCVPVGNDPAARYLAALYLEPPYPDDLRFHPKLFHGPTKTMHPALVLLARRETEPACLFRIFLTDEGRPAVVKPSRMTLGPVREAFLHFSPLPFPDRPAMRSIVLITEQPEDALALRLRHRGLGAIATLTADNMATIEPPLEYGGCIIIPRQCGGLQARRLHRALRTDLDAQRVAMVEELRGTLREDGLPGSEARIEDYLSLEPRIVQRIAEDGSTHKVTVESELRRRRRGPWSTQLRFIAAPSPIEAWLRSRRSA